MSQLLIKGGTCVNPDAVFKADVLIDEGHIVAIGDSLASSAEREIEAHGKLVLPGGVDIHVHLPWPGEISTIDDVHSGTWAAAFGGVTSVIDFAVPEAEEGLGEALGRKIQSAEGMAWVDYGLHVVIRGEAEPKVHEIPDLVEQGFSSFKIFMAYEDLRVPDDELFKAMQAIAAADGVLMVHAEDGLLADHLTRNLVASGNTALEAFALARPDECEIEAIHRLLTYARVLGTSVHVAHVSTGMGAQLIGQARLEGYPVTGETCPHFLLFNDEVFSGKPELAAYLVCAPSIKSAENQKALWSALENGTLSFVSTDHTPHSKELKERDLTDFTKVLSGVTGVETRLPLIYTEGVQAGRIDLSRFVQVWATNAARKFGMYPQKGVIATGSDADLVIIDPEQRTEIRSADLHMKSDALAYEGREVWGVPEMTILRGEVLVEGGEMKASDPPGEILHRFPQRAATAN